MIDQIKIVIEKLVHSPGRVPYTYHHDHIRGLVKYKDLSRGDISNLKFWNEEELYATALIQILEQNAYHVIFNLTKKDINICKKAQILRDLYINKII
jgi:hypothetical protein